MPADSLPQPEQQILPAETSTLIAHAVQILQLPLTARSYAIMVGIPVRYAAHVPAESLDKSRPVTATEMKIILILQPASQVSTSGVNRNVPVVVQLKIVKQSAERVSREDKLLPRQVVELPIQLNLLSRRQSPPELKGSTCMEPIADTEVVDAHRQNLMEWGIPYRGRCFIV
ncbi:MAG: hypothetical protein N2691_01900 [Patescibacteria group bacterium]|nr:hypothetical protein [Patescibacteria group bacterium]